MYDLPEPGPTAAAAGQATPTNDDRDTIRRLFAALDEVAAEKPTAVRVEDPSIPSYKDGPRVGDAPPVDQPGRPAMSSRATDASVMMIAGGFLSICLGAAVSGVLYFSGKADQTVVIALCAGPPVTFLALKSLVKGVKRAVVPDVHNHTYTGPVHQQQHTDQRRSVWQKNTNRK